MSNRIRPSGDVASAAQWERFVARDSSGRASWYQWADFRLCDAWIARAYELTTTQRESALDNRPYDVQLAAVREAWAAIAYAYRAADIRPQIDPRYRQTFARWYGSTTPIDPTRTDAFDPARGDIGPSYVLGGVIRERIVSKWAELRKAPIDNEHRLCNVVARVLLSHRAEVIEQCTGRFGGSDGLCSFVGLFTGSVQDRKNRENDGSIYDWSTLAWHDPPALWGAAEYVCRVEKALPPLRWFFEIAREIAQSLRERGARGLIEEARTFQIVQNLRQAQLLFPDRIGTVDELLDLSVRLPADVATAAINNPGLKATAAVIGAAAAIAMQVNPVAGVLLGLAAAIYSVLPGAVAIELDEFGRGKPVFEVAFIGNDTRQNIAPETRVPAPPGYTPGTSRAITSQGSDSGPRIISRVPFPKSQSAPIPNSVDRLGLSPQTNADTSAPPNAPNQSAPSSLSASFEALPTGVKIAGGVTLGVLLLWWLSD